MRTVKQVWDAFSNRFSNHPMYFTDEIRWDWYSKTWTLSFFPLATEANFKPIVQRNNGTFASPSWVSLTENTDYSINYETGHLTLSEVVPQLLDTNGEPSVTMRVMWHHLKLNFTQFAQFFNEAVASMMLMFPIKKFSKVLWTDVSLIDGEQYTTLDISHAYWKGKKILELFDEEDQSKHLLFRQKGTMLYFDSDVNRPRKQIFWGPTDYNRAVQFQTAWYLPMPFWVSFVEEYPNLDLTTGLSTVLALDSKLKTEDGSELNMILRIWVSMYSMREHWSERVNASTLRLATLKDVQMAKMSVQKELMEHNSNVAPGRGNLPPTTSLT